MLPHLQVTEFDEEYTSINDAIVSRLWKSGSYSYQDDLLPTHLEIVTDTIRQKVVVRRTLSSTEVHYQADWELGMLSGKSDQLIAHFRDGGRAIYRFTEDDFRVFSHYDAFSIGGTVCA